MPRLDVHLEPTGSMIMMRAALSIVCMSLSAFASGGCGGEKGDTLESLAKEAMAILNEQAAAAESATSREDAMSRQNMALAKMRPIEKRAKDIRLSIHAVSNALREPPFKEEFERYQERMKKATERIAKLPKSSK